MDEFVYCDLEQRLLTEDEYVRESDGQILHVVGKKGHETAHTLAGHPVVGWTPEKGATRSLMIFLPQLAAARLRTISQLFRRK